MAIQSETKYRIPGNPVLFDSEEKAKDFIRQELLRLIGDNAPDTKYVDRVKIVGMLENNAFRTIQWLDCLCNDAE